MKKTPGVIAVVGASMTLLFAGGPAAQGSAAGKHCRSVHAGGHRATHVFVDYMSCRSARKKLHHWMGRGSFPKHTNGWYCYKLGGRVHECSFPGRSNPSRDFTFWLRRA